MASSTEGFDIKEFIADGPPFNGQFGPEKAPGIGMVRWDGDILVMTVKMEGTTGGH